MNEPHKGEKFTIPEHIVRIAPKMHMTLAGQIRLLAFTKEVIEEVYQEHMLFQELFDACILETQTQGRYPQWKMMYELLRSHNFDNKTPSTDYKGVKATQHAIAGSPAGTPPLKDLDKLLQEMNDEDRNRFLYEPWDNLNDWEKGYIYKLMLRDTIYFDKHSPALRILNERYAKRTRSTNGPLAEVVPILAQIIPPHIKKGWAQQLIESGKIHGYTPAEIPDAMKILTNYFAQNNIKYDPA